MPITIKDCSLLDIKADAIIVQSNYRFLIDFHVLQVKPALWEVMQSYLPVDHRKKQLYEPEIHSAAHKFFQTEFPDQIGNYTVFQSTDNFPRFIVVMDPLSKIKDVLASQTIVQSLKHSIISMLQFLQDHQIRSVAMPLLGMGEQGLPMELAQTITIQSVQEYMRNYDDRFRVTLVNSFQGLPQDMASDEEIFYGDIENQKQDAELHALYQDFLMNRKIFLNQNISETEESYGHYLQIAIMNQYIRSEYELVKATGLNKNTFAKFRKGETQKHSKDIQLRIAIGMELPLEEFCRYIWASGDTFPNDKRDHTILEFVRDGIYDRDAIDERVAGCAGSKSKLIKEKDA